MDARGYLRITGRLKDIIIRGGENIHPAEIEERLGAHPDVAEVAVLGVPDERWGEQVGAVIRPTDPTRPPRPAALRDHCRATLVPFKTPARWFLVEEFPLTPSGKIQKFVLREQLAEGRLSYGRTRWLTLRRSAADRRPWPDRRRRHRPAAAVACRHGTDRHHRGGDRLPHRLRLRDVRGRLRRRHHRHRPRSLPG